MLLVFNAIVMSVVLPYVWVTGVPDVLCVPLISGCGMLIRGMVTVSELTLGKLATMNLASKVVVLLSVVQLLHDGNL